MPCGAILHLEQTHRMTTRAASVSLVALAPATMPLVTTVDERYTSYNVEMLEVTAGKFWRL